MEGQVAVVNLKSVELRYFCALDALSRSWAEVGLSRTGRALTRRRERIRRGTFQGAKPGLKMGDLLLESSGVRKRRIQAVVTIITSQ